MNAYKTFSRLLQASTVTVVSLFFSASVNALTLGQLMGAVTPPQAQAAPPSTNSLSSGLTPSNGPSRQADPGLWKTKAEFLAAARSGDLIAIDRVSFPSKEATPIAISIAAILQTDYGVTLPFKEINQRAIDLMADGGCAASFTHNVGYALQSVTKMHAMTLSNKAPDFYNPPSNESIRSVELMVQNMQKGTGSCDPTVLGVWKPHPYKAALLKLMDEYGQATKDYIEAERTSKKTAYADAQAQQQAMQKARADAQAKQDADAKVAEQQRIETEHARIEAEEKKREEQNKKRIGG